MNLPQQAGSASSPRAREMVAAVAVAVASAAVVISITPLLLSGFGMGHDWIFELVRIAEFRHAVEGGQLPPFWAPKVPQA